MNVKFLGEFKIIQVDNEFDLELEDYINVFANVKDESDYYELDLFMRSNEIIEGIGEIHGVYGETNNSSVVLQWQFNEDGCEIVKLWRIY